MMQSVVWVSLVCGFIALLQLIKRAASSDRVAWWLAGYRSVLMVVLVVMLHEVVLYLCADLDVLLFCPVLYPSTLYLIFTCCFLVFRREFAYFLSNIIARYRNKKALPRLGY